jgi:hypothetical protein
MAESRVGFLSAGWRRLPKTDGDRLKLTDRRRFEILWLVRRPAARKKP